uniref:28S ribosomal protein S9, mitochondrial n=1 Tax=Parasteatoda tepidariorum TaxID=114398 RepID=A0A2L2YBZ3_PARTP
MISCINRSAVCATKLHRSVFVPCNCSVFQRFKSEVATSLPDNIPILKAAVSSSSAALRVKTINKAMKAYLERAKNYENFLKVKSDEYEIGRQHLANMMGLEAGTMTQEDVDKAIAYLLPSGLYEKKARPMMKPPAQMFPKEKAAQFDMDGRPFSPFFYTRKSNYHTALHQIVGKFHELDQFEDKMIARGILEPPPEKLLNLSGGEWFSIDEMKNMFLENINEVEYSFLIQTLERLCSHPYSFRVKEDICKYRRELQDIVSMTEVPDLMYDENGRPYMEAIGIRKFCHAKVTVRGNGTGKVKINDGDVFYLDRLEDREQVMYPLVFTKMLGLVDIEVDVTGNGEKARAGAIRLGIALCLRSFVPDDVEKMRIAGLLTRDRRVRGRKIYGQKGCRAKFTWKKR